MQEVFEKIIEKLKNLGWVFADYYPDGTNINRVSKKSVSYNEVVEIIKQAAAEYNNGWITCNGVLYPDDMEDVLISIGGLKAIPAYRQNGKWYLTDCRGSSTEVKDQFRVTAWQPLPEPYKPKGEVEHCCEQCKYSNLGLADYPCAECDSNTNDLFEPKGD